MVFWWTCPSSRPTLGGKGKRGRAQHFNVIPSIDPSSNVTDCSSVNKHFIIWQLCFWIFFDGAKTHSWQHLPRFARAFLRRAVRVFSALSLDAYRPHTELFSEGFPTKLREGTCHMISNGNRTEWSPIRSVIIRVINKIGRPRSGSPICLITSMITDRIGRHEVLLPINHNFNKICDIWGSFFNQNTRNSEIFFASSDKKKPFNRARDGAYCPIT